MKRIAREKAGTPEGDVARRKLRELGEQKQWAPFVPFKSITTGLSYNTWEEWLGSEEFVGKPLRKKHLEV